MQPVSRLYVDLTAEPCRSTLIGFKRISGNELKNNILSAKPKTCSLDPLPTWLLKSCIDVPLPRLLRTYLLRKAHFLRNSRSRLSVLLSRKKLSTPTNLVITGLSPIFRSCQRYLKELSPLNSTNISMTTDFMPECNRPRGSIIIRRLH